MSFTRCYSLWAWLILLHVLLYIAVLFECTAPVAVHCGIFYFTARFAVNFGID
jgi:hypothetical protein